MRRSVAFAAVTAVALTATLAAPPMFAGRTAGLRFHAQSQAWLSPQQGWLLGSTDCGSTTCTAVVRTTDGGTTWKTLGTVGAPLTNEQPTGVTELRFADNLHGWAFAPALWATSDGGVTWQEQASPTGYAVLALAANSSVAYAVFSGCDSAQGLSGCRQGPTLWRTTPGQASWTKVTLRLPVASEALLAVRGLVAYVVVATPGSTAGTVVDATTDGQRWSSRPDPCSSRDGEYVSSIATLSDTGVAMLCQADIGFGKAEKRVLRSNDTAQSFTSTGTLSVWGIISQLAASPNGTLLLSSFSIGSWIYRNAGGETWTTSEDLGDGGIGWNDILFTTDQLGFVIHGPASCCGGFGPGELWKTQDGGVTWRQTVVTPQRAA
jgi:hypothetical protein